MLPFPGPGRPMEGLNGGGRPVWSRDGKELFYIWRPMSWQWTSSSRGRRCEPANRAPVSSSTRPETHSTSPPTASGFLFTVLNETARPDPITLVQNWAAGLKP